MTKSVTESVTGSTMARSVTSKTMLTWPNDPSLQWNWRRPTGEPSAQKPYKSKLGRWRQRRRKIADWARNKIESFLKPFFGEGFYHDFGQGQDGGCGDNQRHLWSWSRLKSASQWLSQQLAIQHITVQCLWYLGESCDNNRYQLVGGATTHSPSQCGIELTWLLITITWISEWP